MHETKRVRLEAGLRTEAPVATTVREWKLWLNPTSDRVKADLRDVQAMHVRLCSLVGAARAEAGLLHRLTGHTLTVQARMSLDLARLPRGYLLAAEERPVRLDWPEGARVRWEITANPTKTLSRTGRRVGLTDPEDCANWIEARLRRAGLEPHRIDGWRDPVARGRHRRGRIIVAQWIFRGTGTVVQTEPLAHAIAAGIGKGRAYGAGLLSVTEDA